jgi:UDP-3-O-[3-hydroxymyristoyl] glucosamine N-acyltransferase
VGVGLTVREGVIVGVRVRVGVNTSVKVGVIVKVKVEVGTALSAGARVTTDTVGVGSACRCDKGTQADIKSRRKDKRRYFFISLLL